MNQYEVLFLQQEIKISLTSWNRIDLEQFYLLGEKCQALIGNVL